jgi:hypothetical protein
MAVGPLKVLRKAAEPPAGGLGRMLKTCKPTNHLRRRDGRAFILPSVAGTPATRLALSSEPVISSARGERGLSSERLPRCNIRIFEARSNKQVPERVDLGALVAGCARLGNQGNSADTAGQRKLGE